MRYEGGGVLFRWKDDDDDDVPGICDARYDDGNVPTAVVFPFPPALTPSLNVSPPSSTSTSSPSPSPSSATSVAPELVLANDSPSPNAVTDPDRRDEYRATPPCRADNVGVTVTSGAARGAPPPPRELVEEAEEAVDSSLYRPDRARTMGCFRSVDDDGYVGVVGAGPETARGVVPICARGG